MFVQAVEEVLRDEGIQLPSPLAAAALQAATTLHTWCQDPTNQYVLFSLASLRCKLERVLTQTASKFQRRRDQMWGMYHACVPLMRSSFISLTLPLEP